MTTTAAAVMTADLTFARSALLNTLSLLSFVAPKRTTLPVMQCAIFDVGEFGIRVQATDMDRWLSVPLMGDSNGAPGLYAVPVKRLHDIVASLPPEAAVRLRITGTSAVLTAGKARFEMRGMLAEEFPDAPVRNPRQLGTTPQRAFADALRRLSSVASTEESRPALAGVCVDARGGNVAALATDGGAMGYVPLPGVTLPDGTSYHIPRAAGPLFARVAATLGAEDGDDALVSLEAVDGHLRVTVPVGHGDAVLTVRLLNEDFPAVAVRGFLNTLRPRAATVDRLALLGAINRTGLLCGDHQWQRVKLRWSTAAVMVETENAEAGRARDEVPCAYDDGGMSAAAEGAFEIWLNRDHITQCLALFTAEQVVLRMATAAVPVLVHAAGDPDGERAVCATMHNPK